jgi:hypothetical protein
MDVQNIIDSNSNSTGVQRLKSVQIINQLGIFAGVVIWDIDYDAKKINIDILDDKVMDAENGRIISDHSLYSRIEQLIKEESNKVVIK